MHAKKFDECLKLLERYYSLNCMTQGPVMNYINNKIGKLKKSVENSFRVKKWVVPPITQGNIFKKAIKAWVIDVPRYLLHDK